MITINVTFDTKFDSLQKGAEKKAQQAVAQAAFEIEGEAKRRAPVDTGFLRNAITTDQLGPYTWDVTSGAEYSVYVEFGTYKMDAQPFMTPAVEVVRPKFNRAIRNLL